MRTTRLYRLVDVLIRGALWSLAWLALPVALVLFVQWPLRDLIHGYSRQANDVGQWLFALYVAGAATAATRAGRHIGTDLIARGYPRPVRRILRSLGTLLGILPWSLFVLFEGWPTTVQSVAELEKFPDTFDPLYFIIKIAVLLLPALLALQALLDLVVDEPADAPT
jgi:TRAP-type mannitol/chloroaromatic compound transport system permease small subunit